MLIRWPAKIEVRREAKDADWLVFMERCMIPLQALRTLDNV